MKTKFTNRDAARWKKIAAICFEDSVKRDKLQKKIMELQEELDTVNARIEMNQATVKLDTGYTTDDLIDRIVETSDKKDKNGYPVKNTKYVLKYPETYVPVYAGSEAPAEVPLDPEDPFPTTEPESHE
jgi:hypothetical protein